MKKILFLLVVLFGVSSTYAQTLKITVDPRIIEEDGYAQINLPILDKTTSIEYFIDFDGNGNASIGAIGNNGPIYLNYITSYCEVTINNFVPGYYSLQSNNSCYWSLDGRGIYSGDNLPLFYSYYHLEARR